MNESNPRVLLVDDDVNLLDGIQRRLRQQYDITTAADGRLGLDVLGKEEPFPVIVADYKMPGMNGIEFLREAKRVSPHSVSVLFTAWGDLQVAISALHDGGIHRFLNKPCDDTLLAATIKDCLEHYRLVEQERRLTADLQQANSALLERNKELERLTQRLLEMNLELDRMSRVDSLTGLLSRRAWMEAVAAQQELAARHQLQLGLIMVDVDSFKKYNDTYGHHAGDNCLRAIGGEINSIARSSDLCGRFGGEEFIIASVQGAPSGVAGHAERLREAISRLDLPHGGSTTAAHVTVSVGWAAGSGENWETLARQADSALYAAKRAGRNRVVAWCDVSSAAGLPVPA
jgi:two-component system chemotaxis family response regulator WspR